MGQTIFWPKLGPKAPKLPKIHISQTAGRIKLVDPSKWPQEWIYNGRSEICVLRRQPKVPPRCHFLFFRAIYDEVSKVSISRELYVILNWLTFQNDRKTVSLLVFNTINTSRTKGNGLKWKFQVFFWMRFSEFPSKLNSLQHACKLKIIKGKSTFASWEPIFARIYI